MRIVTCGYESGIFTDEIDSYAGASVITSNPTPRTGGYCGAKGGGGGEQWIQWNFGSEQGEFWMGQGFYIPSGNGFAYWRFYDISNNLVLQVQSLTVTDFIRATFNSQTVNSSAPFGAHDVWHYIEIHFIHSDIDGVVQVKIDGEMVIDFLGDTHTVGHGYPVCVRAVAPGGYAWYDDDLAINDPTTIYNNSWTGRVKEFPIRPNGAGDNTGLTLVGAATNWQAVNEVPESATQYVWGGTIDLYDLYNMTTQALLAGYDISNVIPVAIAYVDSGAGKLALMLKSGGVEAQSSDKVLGNTKHAVMHAFARDPSNNPWTQAMIDAIQGGEKVR